MLGFPENALQIGVIMYAVIKTGGKQYRVSAGEKLKVEQLAADIGSEIVLNEVLLVGNGEKRHHGSTTRYRRHRHGESRGARPRRKGEHF